MLYLVRRRGRHRLPDEPVQHRRRRPVPRRAPSPPPSSPAQAWLPGSAATSLLDPGRRDARRRASGPASPACSRSTARRQRGRSRRSCSTRSRRSSSPGYLLKRAAVRELGNVSAARSVLPEGSRGSAAGRSSPARRREVDALRLPRHPRRHPRLVRARQDPLRLRPAGHRPVGDAPPSPAASTSSGWSSLRCCSPVRRRPGRDARPVRRRPTPTAPRSRPGSASPASRSPCSAATTRSASRSAPLLFGFLDEQSNSLDHRAGISQRRRRRSPRASSSSPSSSPTSSSAGCRVRPSSSASPRAAAETDNPRRKGGPA